MKVSPLIPGILLFLTSLIISGCASLQSGALQKVTVLSFPAGANVVINGEPSGTTPLEVALPRKQVHEIRLEKDGYNSAVKYFTPVPNSRSENFVRFGLHDDLGYYVDLEPGTMKAELQSGLVPVSTGADPFERMAQQILQADQKLEAGEITPLEHKYIVEQIIDFFEKN